MHLIHFLQTFFWLIINRRIILTLLLCIFFIKSFLKGENFYYGSEKKSYPFLVRHYMKWISLFFLPLRRPRYFFSVTGFFTLLPPHKLKSFLKENSNCFLLKRLFSFTLSNFSSSLIKIALPCVTNQCLYT